MKPVLSSVADPDPDPHRSAQIRTDPHLTRGWDLRKQLKDETLLKRIKCRAIIDLKLTLRREIKFLNMSKGITKAGFSKTCN